MKKFLSALLAVIIFAAAAAIPASAAQDAYTKKEITAYLFSKDDTTTLTCLFKEDNPSLPYISLTDYLKPIYKEPFSVKKESGGVFTAGNKNGSFKIDVEKDTVTFDDYETVMMKDANPPMEKAQSKFLDDNNDLEYVSDPKPITYDLSAYGIDLLADDGNVYFPLTTVSDIFCTTYFAAQYINGEIYFIKVMDEKKYYEDYERYSAEKRDKNLIDYTYNELCFVFDNLYGAPSKCMLADSIRENGFDKTLETYDDTTKQIKKLLNSESMEDFFEALIILDLYLNDGGHTALSAGIVQASEKSESINITKKVQELVQKDENLLAMAAKSMVGMNASAEIEAVKTASLEKYTVVKAWDKALFLQDGDTGVYIFDEFWDSSVDEFKWSLDYAKDNGIKNFVIDLSCNTGGSADVVTYMMAVMTKQNEYTTTQINTNSNNVFRTTNKVDINLDGKFDDKDKETVYDFNFGILTSTVSFSSANMLPCVAQDNSIPTLGETSGGGACMVSMLTMPEAGLYAISGPITYKRSDGGDPDKGAVPNFYLVTPGMAEVGIPADYTNIFDLKTISEDITKFYKDPSAYEPSEPEPIPAITETVKPAAADSTAKTVIPVFWIVAIIIVLIILIILIIVLVVHKKKAKANGTVNTNDDGNEAEATGESSDSDDGNTPQ